MKRLFGFIVFALTIPFVSGLHAADEIRILRGTAVQPPNSAGELLVQGTSGLTIDATLGEFGAFWTFCDIAACDPGEVINIGIEYNSFDINGQVRREGQAYTFGEDAVLHLVFDGTITLPEFTDTDTVEVTAPFTFSGSLEVPDRDDPANSDVFQLEGSGVATLTLSPNPFFPGWVVGRVTYEFLPRRA